MADKQVPKPTGIFGSDYSRQLQQINNTLATINLSIVALTHAVLLSVGTAGQTAEIQALTAQLKAHADKLRAAIEAAEPSKP